MSDMIFFTAQHKQKYGIMGKVQKRDRHCFRLRLRGFIIIINIYFPAILVVDGNGLGKLLYGLTVNNMPAKVLFA